MPLAPSAHPPPWPVPATALAAGLALGLLSAALVRRWPRPGPPSRTLDLAVVAASGILAGGAVLGFGAGPRGLAVAVLVVALVPVVAIDLRHRLIPDVVVLPAATAGLGLCALADPGRWWAPAAAAGGAAAFMLLLWLVHPAGMGLGDVKLALLMGAVLGGSVIPAMAVAFAGGAAAAALALARFGRRARAMGIPFGPFLAAGALAGLWAGPDMLGWYTGLVR